MQLKFAEEILLLLLGDDGSHLALVPQEKLDLALAGAVLSDLAFENRIDTDFNALVLIDSAPTGDGLLDSALSRIAGSKEAGNAEHWLREIAKDGGALLERALDDLLAKGILQSVEGTDVQVSQGVLRSRRYPSAEGEAEQEVRLRIMRILFDGDLPGPRDAIIIALADACGLFKGILTREELADRRSRIDLLAGMDPVGRALAKIVEEIDAGKEKARPAEKPIPAVKGIPIFGSAFEAKRNLVPFLAEQYLKLGPVFRVRLFNRNFIALAGPDSNRFLQKQGRNFLRSHEFWKDFTHELGVTRVLTSTDGRDHGKFRRTFAPAYSRNNLEINLETASETARSRVASWPTDRPIDVVHAIQRIVTDQIGEIATGFKPGEYHGDIAAFLDILLIVKLAKQSPSFLYSRRLREARRRVEEFWRTILAEHQPGGPRHGASNFVTEVLELHHADPQQMPETDLMIWAMGPFLVGMDTVAMTTSFALYNILKNPDILRRAVAEADSLFEEGAPTAAGLRKMDTIHRTAMETLRRHPVVPVSPRHVGTGFEFAGYRIPAGESVLACSTATHFLPEFFPEPDRFDIDRYLPERAEHKQRDAFAPFGLGTHRCLGAGFAEAQILLILAAIVRDAELVLHPPSYELKSTYSPILRPRNLKVRLARRRLQ